MNLEGFEFFIDDRYTQEVKFMDWLYDDMYNQPLESVKDVAAVVDKILTGVLFINDRMNALPHDATIHRLTTTTYVTKKP